MSAILGGILGALMLFYAIYLWRSAWYFGQLRPAPPAVDLPSVTVIIPARNEAGSIGACLAAIAEQDYPQELLEVIVVDDQSTDDTAAIARSYGDRLPRLRVLSLEEVEGVAYKKAAVALAIAHAGGEWIVTTDADCVAGPGWLRAMAASMRPGTAMVSGPVELTGNSLFERFQSLEFMGLIAVGAGSIAAGQPTMCNGANLAYRKASFERVGGFSGVDHIASGDDELLMHKLSAEGEEQIAFAKDRAAVVQTPAQPDWEGFKAQRIRWVSKSTQYREFRITLILMVSWVAMAGFPILLLAGLIWPVYFWWVLVLLGLKMAAELVILSLAARFFRRMSLLWLLPLEQIAHIGYVLWVGLAGNRKSYTWKGRTVR